MRIESLFPELCNLYGDSQNIRYLSLCLPEAELVLSNLNRTPAFVTNEVDLLYMGPMTESAQLKVIERLLPYRERIAELIDNGTVLLFTGNAFEVLTEHIFDKEKETDTEGLGLLPFQTEIRLFERFNGKVLGTFDRGGEGGESGAKGIERGNGNNAEVIEVVGFKNQFSSVYGDNSSYPFLTCQRGAGLNAKSTFEGVRVNNFFGTSLLGPLLILNPLFTRYLLKLLGTPNPTLAFEADAITAYQARLQEFKTPQTTGFTTKGH
ncbi:MAG: glutamine amidotransferase [Coriobacteriales bacterium]|jgi:CobQ-like glutamine amidotransferase family enzyme|nr:glutamine amidotransferase [Coriobacteriales bacterium]